MERDDIYASCPYDSSHKIVKFRMPKHIVKCMRNYRGPPLQTCTYNATHRVPKEEMDDHLKSCPDFYAYAQGANARLPRFLKAYEQTAENMENVWE